jgi:amino acid adenylation domain-containing protein
LLYQAGVKLGDRVILYGVNSDRLVTALFGILKAGAAFVPVHPETSIAKLEFILQDCTPSAIVADRNLLERQDSPIKNSTQPILLTSDSYNFDENDGKIKSWKVLEAYLDCQPDVKITSDDLAAIIYTSGSTKDPRGVIEPHRQIIFASTAINAVIQNNKEDKVLCGLPLSFDYGLYQIFLTFQVGATLILEKDFSVPLSIPRILKLNDVTGFPGVPSVFAMLLRSRLLERVELPNLRYITSTGDIFPVPHIRWLKELFPHTTIFPMYGLTECKRVSIMPKGQWDSHEFSVGQALPGTQVFIVDEDGKEVPSGIIGELVIRGTHVMAGYWNVPEETSRRFRYNSLTGEILLHSGDFFKKDQDGFLYFVGRDDTLIKSRGHRISPSEIESFLCGLNGIAEAAVVGIPDAIQGESVCAYVSLNNTHKITEADIIEACKHGLSLAARPQHVLIFDSALPKTSNGKLDRTILRKMAILNKEQQIV